jgi:hypothetical protein
LVLAQIKLDPAEYTPLVAPLVDIPVPLERLPRLSPDEMHSKQLAAMVAWAIAGARVQPIVLVFEDLQWFDPSSIELIHALSEHCADAPLLILATARPEFRLPWSPRSHHGAISLTPLDTAQVQRMVAEIASRHALSTEMARGLNERAGGVPLFVEELTHLLLEQGEHGGAASNPADPAPVAGGAPRSAGNGARGRADRRSAWAKLFLSASVRRRFATDGRRPTRRSRVRGTR